MCHDLKNSNANEARKHGGGKDCSYGRILSYALWIQAGATSIFGIDSRIRTAEEGQIAGGDLV